MYLSFVRFHWLRFSGAIIALSLAIIYLLEFEGTSLIGFSLLAAVGIFLGMGLRNGTLPARCDLCGSSGHFSAEYGAGFSNARLILSCPRCGRVVSNPERGIIPEQE
ncbi:hypothetical protein [Desulfopila sp. IMCC35008]|uniref:hypothetical protein n=1 Tax=Desulfopila sp. IMCC35008 TaxID=2653858 RepID=UPI0013CF6D98|nr:hypothetical protein [Desulfopila sp. IMCC35008]